MPRTSRLWQRYFPPKRNIGAPTPSDYLKVTAHQSPSLRIAVAGDVGTREPQPYATAEAIAKEAVNGSYDALVLLGDNIYPHGDPALLNASVFEPFAPVLQAGTELLAVLGNHDVDSGRGDAVAAGLGMPARWYAKEFGELLFVGLDSTQPESASQQHWLEETLEATEAIWKIVALHHPLWSAGWHGSDLANRAAFAATFDRHRVQLVLAGHEHDYQRSKPIGATTYVVTGGAAHLRPTARARFTEVAWSVHHFVDLSAVGDRLVLRAIDDHGGVFDEYELPPR